MLAIPYWLFPICWYMCGVFLPRYVKSHAGEGEGEDDDSGKLFGLSNPQQKDCKNHVFHYTNYMFY